MMLHRGRPFYEMMVVRGKKPFMFLVKESPRQTVLNIVVEQKGKYYFNLQLLDGMNV